LSHRPCTVSFVERGVRHEAKVDAESAYEAAVFALKQWRGKRFVKGPSRHAVLELSVVKLVMLKLKVSDVLSWLYEKPGKSPAEQMKKKQLRDLLADDRH
jgi:hypothetical protein